MSATTVESYNPDKSAAVEFKVSNQPIRIGDELLMGISCGDQDHLSVRATFMGYCPISINGSEVLGIAYQKLGSDDILSTPIGQITCITDGSFQEASLEISVPDQKEDSTWIVSETLINNGSLYIKTKRIDSSHPTIQIVSEAKMLKIYAPENPNIPAAKVN